MQQLAFKGPLGDRGIPPKFIPWSGLPESALLAGQLHSVVMPAGLEANRSGCNLWNLTGDDNTTNKPRRSLLPVLTVLFVVSYGLLTMLVVEQGRTIDSQRSLINMLFSDSVQLSSIKGRAIQKQQAEAQAKTQSPKKSVQGALPDPQGQAPSTRQPQAGAKNQSTSKVGRPFPQRPPKETVDQGDDRRTLISI